MLYEYFKMRFIFSCIGGLCIICLLVACGSPPSSRAATPSPVAQLAPSPVPSATPLPIANPTPFPIANTTPTAPPVSGSPIAPLPTPNVLPTPTRGPVSFKRDVQPVLNKYCVKCHSNQSILGKVPNNYRTTSYADVMKGGDYGIDVLPFKPDDSRLIFFITGKKMPGDGTAVDPADLDILIQWVATGAKND